MLARRGFGGRGPRGRVVGVEVGFNRGAELVAGSAKLPHSPGQHPPDLGEPLRANHQQSDHEDDQELLNVTAELKHDVTLRGLTSPLQPRHDPGPVVENGSLGLDEEAHPLPHLRRHQALDERGTQPAADPEGTERADRQPDRRVDEAEPLAEDKAVEEAGDLAGDRRDHHLQGLDGDEDDRRQDTHRSSIACISCLSSYTRTTKRYAGVSVTISQAQRPSASAETTAPRIKDRRVPTPEGVTLDGRSAIIIRRDYALAQA